MCKERVLIGLIIWIYCPMILQYIHSLTCKWQLFHTNIVLYKQKLCLSLSEPESVLFPASFCEVVWLILLLACVSGQSLWTRREMCPGVQVMWQVGIDTIKFWCSVDAAGRQTCTDLTNDAALKIDCKHLVNVWLRNIQMGKKLVEVWAYVSYLPY